MLGKVIGSVLIVTGTAVGAGMLALPIAASYLGFFPAIFLLLGTWLLMTYTALLVLEVVLTLKVRSNHFHSMAAATLGIPGKIIAWVCCLLLLYSLTCAYISGASSLLSSLLENWGIHLSRLSSGFLFTLLFGGVVFYGTEAVDLINRGFMTLKFLSLAVAMALLLPSTTVQWPSEIFTPGGLVQVAPIFLTAFGFHTVIPSVMNYLGPKPRILQRVIVLGALIPFLIYLIWLAVTLRVLPAVGSISFEQVHHANDSLPVFLNGVIEISKTPWVSFSLHFFANVAMTTSFLGVTLGLFDFLADGFKRSNNRLGRSQTALLTFVPPFLIAQFYQAGFVLALRYAGIFVAVLEIILPALMVFVLRRQVAREACTYRVLGGYPALVLVLCCGVLFAALGF